MMYGVCVKQKGHTGKHSRGRSSRKSRNDASIEVIVKVDGKEYTRAVCIVPRWAVDHVVTTAVVQIEEPDIEGAKERRA
jgi:hypothetical protein